MYQNTAEARRFLAENANQVETMSNRRRETRRTKIVAIDFSDRRHNAIQDRRAA